MASNTKSNTKARRGSLGARSNYDRLVGSFGVSSPATGTASAQYRQATDGTWGRWDGSTWVQPAGGPGGPPSTLPPVSDVRPFVAAEVFNKVILLAGIALIFGVLGALLHVPVPVAVVCMVAALVVAVVTMFRPRKAPVLAPVFAALEGVTLGVISTLFAGQSTGVIPLAIIGTTVIFFGVLAAYRTGLVKVGP
ncbi:MAG: Bax inhibitor-1/YccA family membrane protein, partial [Acidimicrobiales bacterium]